ncbi:uncharacterized protein EMH_0016430 [Eimeria mitis]|uniref:Uncharacterized protein n=1 Tax=Eimeria mitis TaxID=44415 RepID=U6K9P6_9EIME|nr:uncharacterized protein EMH_0016430 [Eimeria mitis]CDJ33531.1 hypothetical protein EMH_0016430 [Eimeria mitis]
MLSPSLQASGQRVRTADVNPGLDPDSWLESIPSIDSHPEQEARGEPSPVTDDGSMAGQVLASPASTQGHPEGLREILQTGDIRKHPYVRLPVLEEDVVPKCIRVSALFSKDQKTFYQYGYLVTVRELLHRRKLSQEDADSLVQTIERLVATSWFKSKKGPTGPSPICIVDTLGMYFLAFDAIICAVELLGDAMQLPLWWEKFTASFTTSFPLASPGSRGREVTRFHIVLARRLSAALEIYKRGMRPPLPEVVTLKKLLFCYPLGRHKFKSLYWAPWRKDGGC